jgi:hypothetical protein
VGFIGALRPEGPGHQHVSRHNGRPGLAQRAGECEEHRASRQRDHHAGVAQDMAAGVHDKGFRGQQGFDLLEQQGAFHAPRHQPCRGRLQNASRRFDLRHQRRDRCQARGLLGA